MAEALSVCGGSWWHAGAAVASFEPGLKARRALLLVDFSAFLAHHFSTRPSFKLIAAPLASHGARLFLFYAFVPPSSILTLLPRRAWLRLVARCGAAATPASIRPKAVAFFLDGLPIGWSAW